MTNAVYLAGAIVALSLPVQEQITQALITRALGKFQAANMEFQGNPVTFTRGQVERFVSWGSPTSYQPPIYKQVFLQALRKPNLPLNVHLGSYTAYIGRFDNWAYFPAPSGNGISIVGMKPRLVVFVPYDDDGLQTPELLIGGYNGYGNEYIPVQPNAGFYAVKILD